MVDEVNEIRRLVETRSWVNIRNAINMLKENTGVGLAFDPYKDPDRLLWNDIGVGLLQNGLIMEALTAFQSQLQSYLEVQEKTKRRIHKGTPYHFLGQVYLKIGDLGQAREQTLLAFVEDVLTEIRSKNESVNGPMIQGVIHQNYDIPKVNNAFDCPAPIVLELTFRMRRAELDDLYNFTKRLNSEDSSNPWLYPELIVLKWRNDREKHKEDGPLITRAVEESLFHINSHYLKDLLESATADASGKSMEDLATYLFSCVYGFEPIPKLATESFHFDVVIRNLIREHPLLSMLGEYIGIEAKNISKTVSVEQLNHFIHKLRLHNIRCGIIFTNTGISGVQYDSDLKYGKTIQVSTFNRDNLIVFDITMKDIESIIQGNNLISVLLAKYEDIRFK
jgi:hypothetical protein